MAVLELIVIKASQHEPHLEEMLDWLVKPTLEDVLDEVTLVVRNDV